MFRWWKKKKVEIEREHKACNIKGGFCISHGFAVSETFPCPHFNETLILSGVPQPEGDLGLKSMWSTYYRTIYTRSTQDKGDSLGQKDKFRERW